MKIDRNDVMWGYVSIVLVQGINALLLPFVLIYLNDKELGLWYTFTSIYGLVMLVDFGLQTTISRNISYIWTGADSIKASGHNLLEKNKKLNINYFTNFLSSVKYIYYIIGILVFIVLLTIGTLYIYVITKNEINLTMVMVSWFFYFVAIVLNIMYSFWNAILKGIGAIKEYNKTLIIAKLSQIFFSLILLYLGFGILGITFAYLLSVIINRITLSKFFYNFSEVTLTLKGKVKPKLNSQIIKVLLPNTLKTGVTSISNYLIINFPILLTSYFLSLEISGQFGMVSQIITLCLTISNSYFNTYLAKFNYFRVKNDIGELTKLFKKSIMINYCINFILFLGLILFGQYILDIFASEKLLLSTSLMLIIIVYRFLYNNQTIFVSLLSTKNEIPYYKTFIVSALITVSIQITLLFLSPIILSIILPILIVQLIYNNWYWPLQVVKDLRS